MSLLELTKTQLLHPLLCAFIIFLIITLIFINGSVYEKIQNYIHLQKLPGPKRHPILGNILDGIADEVTIFEKQRKWAKKYSPLYVILAFPYCFVNCTRPEEVEKLISTTKNLSKSFFYDFFHVVVGEGLGTSSGSKWHQRRKLINPAFHFTVLQGFVGVFQKLSNKLVNQFEELVDTENGVINVNSLLNRFGLNAINETAMGISLNINNRQDSDYIEAVENLLHLGPERIVRPWLHNDFIYYQLTRKGAKAKEYVKNMHSFIDNVVQNKMTEMGTKSKKNVETKHMAMLDLLINAKNDGKIDLNGIHEEINTFMFAGHDTSSTCLAFTLMLLANHQNIQNQIYCEMNEVLPDPEEILTIGKLNELKFMERCIKESLRLYPPGTLISRVLDEDFTTKDHFVIPKGTTVCVHIYDLHRNPEVFTNPEQFDPDRFLPENVKNRHPYSYIPFSAGPRNCIGQKFAMLEIKVVLLDVLRKFQLEPVDTPETLILHGQIILKSKNGIRVKFVKRHQ